MLKLIVFKLTFIVLAICIVDNVHLERTIVEQMLLEINIKVLN